MDKHQTKAFLLQVETKAKSDGKLLHTDTFQSGSPIGGASGTIINLPANTEVFMVVRTVVSGQSEDRHVPT